MKRLQSKPTSKEFAKKILATSRAAINTDSIYRGFIMMEVCESGDIKVSAHLQYNNNWRGTSDSFQYGELMEETPE